MDMRRLIFKNFLSEPSIFYRHLKFLCLGSKSVQIFHIVLNLFEAAQNVFEFCFIGVLNVAEAALFRF
jgi:hypothetical protein